MYLFLGVSKVANLIRSNGGADAFVGLGNRHVHTILGDAAFLVQSTVNGSVLAAAVTWVFGGVRSSGVWLEWVGTSAGVAVSMDIVGGGTVGTAAGVLSVVTSGDYAIVLLVKVVGVARLKRSPSGVEGDVPDIKYLGKTDSKDSVTFACVSSASMRWSDRLVVEALYIVSVEWSGELLDFLPFVTSLLWVACATEVNIEAFVAEGKLFADSVDSVHGRTITRCQVMLSLGQAPAAVVAVSSEYDNFWWLERHDHSLEILESPQLVQAVEITLAHLTTTSSQVVLSLFEHLFELEQHLAEIVVHHKFFD